MDSANQHAFWKQRVYKEERDRYLQHSRSGSREMSPSSARLRASGGRVPQLPSPEHDGHFLPPLKLSDSQSPKASFNSNSAHSPTARAAYDHANRLSSPVHVSYRPRGPPATIHGVNPGYHTFTYQGRTFLEDTSQ